MNSNPNDIETVELDEPRRINEISELSIGDKIVFERRKLTDEDIESKRPLRVVDGASKTVRSTHSDSFTGAEPYETRLFAIEARGEWEGARTYCFADAYNTFDGELAGIVDHDNGIMVEIALVATAEPVEEDDAASTEFETARELACDGGQVQTETTTEHHIPGDDAVIMSNPTSLRDQVDMRQCPRCEREIHALDMESDPRWGEVCDGCHAELVDEHGPVSETSFADEQERGRPMTDGGRDSFQEDCESQLGNTLTDPIKGSMAIDLVTRQVLYIHKKKYDNLEEHYEAEGYNLMTYKTHPYLPVRADDSVFECVFVTSDPERIHNVGDTYDFPRGRLAHVPVEQAWGGELS